MVDVNQIKSFKTGVPFEKPFCREINLIHSIMLNNFVIV